MAKICMIAYTFYACDPRVRREAEALAERGDDVDFICLQEPVSPMQRDYDGVRLYPISAGRYQGGSTVAYLIKYISFFLRSSLLVTRRHLRNRYDLIQVHTMPDFLVFAALIPKLLGAKVVLDVHDLMPELYTCKFASGKNHFLVRLITRVELWSIRFAHRAIAVHNPHRDALVSHGNPPEKFSVVLNVPDPRIFNKGGGRSNDGKFRMIYHGTVARRHGLEVALRAVKLIRTEIPNLEFLVIGAGDDFERIQAVSRELGLDDCVRFLGRMPVEQLPKYLAEVDLGVVPILYDSFTRYMLPLKLLEYVHMGIPCVVSDTETIRAYFTDEMVRFFKPGDVEKLAEAIRELARDPVKRQQLAARAAAFNATYNWEQEKQRYYATVDGVLEPVRVNEGLEKEVVRP